MKYSIGVYNGACETGGSLIKMLDFENKEYVLPEHIHIDSSRPHLFSFNEQDQFCKVVHMSQLSTAPKKDKTAK